MALVSLTLSDMVYASLRVLHAVAPGQVLSANEMEDAVQAYTLMMAEWMASGFTLTCSVQDTLTLTANRQSYRIGDGLTAPDFNTARPNEIVDNAYMRDAGGVDYPVALIGDDQWQDVIYKSTVGTPYWLHFRPAYPYGTMDFFPKPDYAYILFMNSLKEMDQITDPTTALSIPGYYLNAIKFNLALNLAPEYEKEPTPFLQKRAKEALAVVERQNADNQLEAVRLGLFARGWSTDYDVESDTWRR